MDYLKETNRHDEKLKIAYELILGVIFLGIWILAVIVDVSSPIGIAISLVSGFICLSLAGDAILRAIDLMYH